MTAKEPSTPVNKGYAGYTFGYNRPLAADRVHDILTAVAWVKGRDGVKSIDLVGFGKAGPLVTLGAPAGIVTLAHTLNGSARGIGAWRVARAAEALERAATATERCWPQ